jgi:amino acid permease
MNEKEKDVNKKMNSEAQLTTFEAISMIVGNSIGTGIIAVPYLAVRNSMWDVVWMVAFAYIVNVILHLIIAELSYNNGGVQLVKSFEGELFHGKMKKIFSWIMFVVYGLAIMVGVSGNINGGAQIFVNWFGLPLWAAQLIYYLIAGSVVFMGMKAVGIAQKYSVALLLIIVAVMSAGTFLHPRNTLYTAPFHINNLLALYSMVVFATSANQAVIQVVKGLNGDSKRIRKTIFTGFGLSSLFVLVVTLTVLLGTKGVVDKELAYMQLGESIGGWALILAGIFSLFALLTTFWSNTLALRDVVHEQVGTGNRVSWLIATVPCILFAIFGVSSFIVLTRIMSGVVVLVSIMLVLTYGKSRKKVGSSPICGIFGTVPFQVLMMVSTIVSAVGAMLPLK